MTMQKSRDMGQTSGSVVENMIRVAVLEEREKCAKIADAIAERHDRASGGMVPPAEDYEIGRRDGASNVAHAIRSRGQQ